MTRFAPLSCLVMMIAVLGLTSAVYAGEALEPLRGGWAVESVQGQPMPAEVKLAFEFVDDDTMKVTVVMAGQEPESQEFRYSATADGTITVFSEEEPAGEKAKWEVKDDKKLYITSEDGETMVLKRPA